MPKAILYKIVSKITIFNMPINLVNTVGYTEIKAG